MIASLCTLMYIPLPKTTVSNARTRVITVVDLPTDPSQDSPFLLSQACSFFPRYNRPSTARGTAVIGSSAAVLKESLYQYPVMNWVLGVFTEAVRIKRKTLAVNAPMSHR